MTRLWTHVARYRWRWAWGALMLLCTNAAAMAIPQVFRSAIDDIRGGADVARLRELALLLVVLAAGAAVFRALSRVHIFYAARDVELDVRCTFYRHLSRLEPAFFMEHPVGDLMSRATNDLTQVRLMLGPGLLNIVNTTIAYAVALPLMLLISPTLTLVALLVYPPGFFLMRHLARRLYVRTREAQEALGKITDLVQETLAGAHVVRAFSAEAEREARLRSLAEAYYDANVRVTKVRGTMFPLVLTLGNAGILIAVYFGARSALHGDITMGELVALVEYMALLSWPTFALGWVLSTWQRGRASYSRLHDIMSITPRVRSGPLAPESLVPAIEVRGLSLALGGRRVLEDVSLSLAPGEVLGVVGPIGAGKTTLVNAMLRLLEVPSGHVFIGGHDVTELDLLTLRRAFAYVPQTHMLFSKSLRDNVAFGRPQASDDEVRAALVGAAFESDLSILPQGLDTPIGERGITLSGGQKQRVSLARGLLLSAPILVLDDVLASVDAETEARILSRLERQNAAARSTIVVAHRISAVQHAEHIVVLKDGRIIERGTHDELLRRGGWYADTARRQELERALEDAGAEAAETSTAAAP